MIDRFVKKFDESRKQIEEAIRFKQERSFCFEYEWLVKTVF